jgi:glycosyltransferase involved in cell wall biosynthesis
MVPCYGTILRLSKKDRTSKVISILDNVLPHEKRPGDVAFTKYFFKPVDAFISMSHEVLKDLRQFEKEKPALFSPHPVYDNYGDAIPKDVAHRALGLPENGKYILFFGYIRKYKGLDILLNAMADERIKQAGIKLIVAGEYYDDEAFYQSLIDQLDIRNRLYLFTDFIPNEKVKDYFSAADCVVQPYRNATQSGISQIAYHFEKPMIVTNVGGLPEIVPDGKVGLVTEVSSKAIADAILLFYEENKEQEFSRNAGMEQQKYSWSYFVKNIMSLFSELK